MLRLSTWARDLPSMAVGHHTMFAVLSPKDICKGKVFPVLLFHVFFYLYSSAMS